MLKSYYHFLNLVSRVFIVFVNVYVVKNCPVSCIVATAAAVAALVLVRFCLFFQSSRVLLGLSLVKSLRFLVQRFPSVLPLRPARRRFQRAA